MEEKKLVKFKIEGLNLARLMNFLIQQNVLIYNVSKKDLENVELEIKKEDRKKIDKYVDKKKFKVTEISISQIEKARIFFLQNIYFFISGLLCICAVFVINMFILQKQINGASEKLKQEIEQLLETKQVKNFTLKSNINTVELENEIKLKLKSVSLCSINFKGLTLIVNVKERDEQAGIVKRENIVASQSGFVNSVNLVSGTLMVKKGERVEIGDILIKGEALVNGEVQTVNPIGEVKIIAHYTANLIFNENQEILIRSGRKNVDKYWTLFNNKVKLKQDKEDEEFVLFETEIVKTSNNLFMIIPIKSFERTTYELEKEKVFKSFEENKNELSIGIIEKAKKECDFFGELISQSVETLKLSENVFLIKGNIQFMTSCN